MKVVLIIKMLDLKIFVVFLCDHDQMNYDINFNQIELEGYNLVSANYVVSYLSEVLLGKA